MKQKRTLIALSECEESGFRDALLIPYFEDLLKACEAGDKLIMYMKDMIGGRTVEWFNVMAELECAGIADEDFIEYFRELCTEGYSRRTLETFVHIQEAMVAIETDVIRKAATDVYALFRMPVVRSLIDRRDDHNLALWSKITNKLTGGLNASHTAH